MNSLRFMSTDALREAEQNFQSHLAKSYPGRGIVIGRVDAESWIIVYWIMGRSANSRNRVFVWEDQQLRTEAADPSKVEDPSLIIYHAIRPLPHGWVVSNGTQTDTVIEGMSRGLSFEQSLISEQHEPDAPNFTPRITGLLDLDAAHQPVCLSQIRKSAWGGLSEHSYYHYPDFPAGIGVGLSTYEADGSPLPSFTGRPLLFPVAESPQATAQRYWDRLDPENRISLAALRLHALKAPEVSILNRFPS